MDNPDQAVINSLRKGDVDTYTALFDRLSPKLWRFSARQTGSTDIANDVVQDVFIDLWQRRESLRADIDIDTYLYGAVRRRGLHVLRHEDAQARAAESSAVMRTVWGAAAPISPDRAAEAAELEAALADALSPLSELQRSAFALRRSGLSHGEIAEVLGVTPEAARKHVTRALTSLQSVLARFADR